MAVKVIRKESPVFEDFQNESGMYSCPSVALSAFSDVLEAYGYSMEYTVAANTLHDSILIDILHGDERVGYTHVAWCRYPDGRYSVVGRIVQ